jgi:GPH family glycoside/pentoside/hexuronide:cation symporter
MLPMPPPPGLSTRISYGFGAVAFGIKENGFGYFLLLFYSTVVGLDAGLVGLAIFIALLFDAVGDPVVGYLSDNWHSKWGRRHPFMYASAIPVSLTYYLLWNPPAWSQTALFWYLLVLAVLIRNFITLYETPSSAMMPELSRDYDERTRLQSWRLFFGWVGGNVMTVLMFGVLLVATKQYPVGTLNRDGYATYGIVSSVLIFVAIMVSALGTQRRVAHFAPPPPRRQLSLRRIFGEIFETLGDRSFFALFVATLFGAVATGLSGALAFIMLTYFWSFSSPQIFVFTVLVFISAAVGLALAPLAARRLGKRRAVIVLGVAAFMMAPIPVILRLMDLMPANGDPLLFPIVAAVNTIDLSLIIALQAIFASMIADLVEQSEVRTGRRSEGIFYSAVTFSRKATQGLGALAAGLVLSAVAFPNGAAPAQVPDTTLWRLGASYTVGLLSLWACMILAVGYYKIDRGDHEANLKLLADRATAA